MGKTRSAFASSRKRRFVGRSLYDKPGFRKRE
ncbi:hypothetical protein COLO4_01107 [Corchorus olitorius]|uniref:Uncharacterized protein n=1 Tax=Corchorus olitorius TaxID=93759 RepID=A0A1R3L324_9ROSI|nr:hypothetical protein COLO4_01107 [Corchorus olitorius]